MSDAAAIAGEAALEDVKGCAGMFFAALLLLVLGGIAYSRATYRPCPRCIKAGVHVDATVCPFCRSEIPRARQ